MIHFIMVWQFIFAVVAGSSDVNFKVSDKKRREAEMVKILNPQLTLELCCEKLMIGSTMVEKWRKEKHFTNFIS